MTIAMAATAATLMRSEVVSADALERTISVAPGGTLAIDLDRGQVQVESHDANEVRIEAHARGLSAMFGGFELSQEGNNVHLEGEFRRAFLLVPWGPKVTVRAWVPREYSVVIQTRRGRIDLRDIGGRAIAKTSGGRISVDGAAGPVSLESSGGAIHADAVSGSLYAKTSGGRIEVSQVNGNVELETSGGAIEAKEIAGHLEARTSGGRIEVSLIGTPSGELHTSGGGIEVAIPSHAGVDLDAETSGGRIAIDHDIVVSNNDKRHIVGRINGGGAQLRVHTSGGNIHIRAI